MGKRYVIGGIAGTGKSTLLNELSHYQNTWVNRESGREIISGNYGKEGKAIWDALHEAKDEDERKSSRLKFEELVLKMDLAAYKAAPVNNKNCFFDCGFIEALAYLKTENITIPKDFSDVIMKYRYDGVFFAPRWQELLNAQPAPERVKRAEDFEAALRSSYREAGYEIIEIPKLPIKERGEFIVSRV